MRGTGEWGDGSVTLRVPNWGAGNRLVDLWPLFPYVDTSREMNSPSSSNLWLSNSREVRVTGFIFVSGWFTVPLWCIAPLLVWWNCVCATEATYQPRRLVRRPPRPPEEGVFAMCQSPNTVPKPAGPSQSLLVVFSPCFRQSGKNLDTTKQNTHEPEGEWAAHLEKTVLWFDFFGLVGLFLFVKRPFGIKWCSLTVFKSGHSVSVNIVMLDHCIYAANHVCDGKTVASLQVIFVIHVSKQSWFMFFCFICRELKKTNHFFIVFIVLIIFHDIFYD